MIRISRDGSFREATANRVHPGIFERTRSGRLVYNIEQNSIQSRPGFVLVNPSQAKARKVLPAAATIPVAASMPGALPVIDVLIPAYNEEIALPLVLAALPAAWVRQVIVCNNGSTDATAAVAIAHGAIVVDQPRRGYGNACLAGIRYLRSLPPARQPDLVVFIDGDYSDYPEELPNVVAPILNDRQDMVIGSRRSAGLEPGAMTLPQRFGNWLAPALIRLLYGYRFSDLGPFRAIRWSKLLDLDMRDRTFGWTVEMQVKAARHGLACAEVPVRYRRRAAGHSKVSGTIKGSVLAGVKIIWVILKYVF